MDKSNAKPQGINAKQLIKKLFSEYSYWVSFVMLLILAAIVGQVMGSTFFRWTNISNIFVQSATTTGIIALGMMMVICAGQIDISVGAQVAIIAGLGIDVLNATDSILLMLGFCLLLGLCIGTFNGLLVAKGRMPAMVATLATQSICRSIVNHLGQGGPFTVDSSLQSASAFGKIARGNIQIFGIKIMYPMIIFIALALLFGLIMQRTKLGKHIYAIGSNEKAARLTGVNVDMTKILTFSITGLLCGFVAVLYASRLGAVAAASAGNLFEMDAIAAVAIGGTSMSGGRGKVIGTFLGVLMFKIITNILTMAKVPPFLNGAISGGIIIIAVLLQSMRGKKE